MKIIKGYPPNYVQIRKAFPAIAGQPGLIFTYGQTIYCPSGRPLTKALLQHEVCHIAQQGECGPAAWWERYLLETPFRLSQELLAHQVEWEAAGRGREYLLDAAARLASRIYGLQISKAQAMKLIEGGNL